MAGANVLFEKKMLLGCTGVTLFGCLLEIIAVSTDSWLHFHLVEGLYQNKTHTFLLRVQSGLWRVCRTTTPNKSDSSLEKTDCEVHNFFPTRQEIMYDESIDNQILDYMRTGCAFSIIGLFLMALVHLFAFYTIRRPRYIVKRLTALLHIMTAACVIVTNEVFIRTTEYATDNLPGRIPKSAVHWYGYSFVISWIVFVFYVAAGLFFLFLSHKRKPDISGMENKMAEEDEPMQLKR
ncbi:hypothetical protein ACJMK2_034654 [Sinanodonta woodiana]|uniref:Uncharacterized protein n=1 Tax=Sinanodonta woodiana TaxID=1069815 RepID=A0ABD3WSB1_SINWO